MVGPSPPTHYQTRINSKSPGKASYQAGLRLASSRSRLLIFVPRNLRRAGLIPRSTPSHPPPQRPSPSRALAAATASSLRPRRLPLSLPSLPNASSLKSGKLSSPLPSHARWLTRSSLTSRGQTMVLSLVGALRVEIPSLPRRLSARAPCRRSPGLLGAVAVSLLASSLAALTLSSEILAREPRSASSRYTRAASLPSSICLSLRQKILPKRTLPYLGARRRRFHGRPTMYRPDSTRNP